jgi:LmbE family N-acetylglucosaminyl deacetylase
VSLNRIPLLAPLRHWGAKRLLRRLHRLTHRLPCTLRDVQRARVLVVAPHMDDEAIGAGGTLARHARAGSTADVVWCAAGASETTTRARKEEARVAAALLGLRQLHWLDRPDGRLSRHEPELARELARLVGELRPDQVFCPFPSDHHRDHTAVAVAVAEALATVRFRGEVWCYEIWSPLWPNAAVDITETVDVKRQAIQAHASQVAGLDYVEGAVGLNRYRGMRLYVPFAEAFFVCSAAELAGFAAELNRL